MTKTNDQPETWSICKTNHCHHWWSWCVIVRLVLLTPRSTTTLLLWQYGTFRMRSLLANQLFFNYEKLDKKGKTLSHTVNTVTSFHGQTVVQALGMYRKFGRVERITCHLRIAQGEVVVRTSNRHIMVLRKDNMLCHMCQNWTYSLPRNALVKCFDKYR